MFGGITALVVPTTIIVGFATKVIKKIKSKKSGSKNAGPAGGNVAMNIFGPGGMPAVGIEDTAPVIESIKTSATPQQISFNEPSHTTVNISYGSQNPLAVPVMLETPSYAVLSEAPQLEKTSVLSLPLDAHSEAHSEPGDNDNESTEIPIDQHEYESVPIKNSPETKSSSPTFYEVPQQQTEKEECITSEISKSHESNVTRSSQSLSASSTSIPSSHCSALIQQSEISLCNNNSSIPELSFEPQIDDMQTDTEPYCKSSPSKSIPLTTEPVEPSQEFSQPTPYQNYSVYPHAHNAGYLVIFTEGNPPYTTGAGLYLPLP